ncbi:MAG: hypothetical protein AAFV53_29495 [Myxococcota bacterium]
MPLRDILKAALSGPAGKVVDAPVRDIVNEVLAERGYASPAEVAALREETDRLQAQVQKMQARLDALEKRPVNPPAARLSVSLAPDVPAPPETPLEDRVQWVASSAQQNLCKVIGCGKAAYRDGFCVEHAAAWRAGRLPGFVSPEGLVSINGEPRRVAPSFAGQPYADRNGQVQIDQFTVPSVGY